MNKGVRKVRQSIIERKKKRSIYPNTRDMPGKQIMPAFPQEEEKHGYYPSFIESTTQNRQKNQLISGFIIKGTLSTMLFFGIALLWQTDSDTLSPLKKWTSNSLTEEFPFAKVNHWYQETFGSPLAFTPKQNQVTQGEDPFSLPVNGNVTETFQANGKGIMIAPRESAPVSALQEGIVIFSGNDRDTNKTVVLQHADGSKSTYGYLSSVDVHLYQFIAANQKLGQFSPTTESETVYFSIEQNNEYIDPIQVIKVDDTE